jgi:DNA processing protein
MNLFSFKSNAPSPLCPPPAGEGKISEQEKLAWLRLSRTENVGPVTFYKLIDGYGSAQKALDKLPDLARRGGRKKPLTAPSTESIDREYAALKKIGGEIITAMDDDYPVSLSSIDDAPPVISVLGDPKIMRLPCIAMVGARNASLNGRKFAEKVARDLGARGVIVASGLARGIDTAAHTGALLSGTIAVVAGGIDVIYPEENRALYEDIKERGLIIAESPLGVAPTPQSFPRRNRIVSGLAQGVVVVEATLRSGSLITARLAGEQGRDVYAAPGHPLDPRAEGTNHLIREGAILIRNAEDILEHINNFTGTGLREPKFTAPDFAQPFEIDENAPEDAQDVLLSALSFEATPVDDLIRTSGLGISLAQTILLELELAGRVKRHPGNRISLQ